MVFSCLFLLVLTSCATLATTPKAAAIEDSVTPILQRHDVYARTFLKEPELSQALHESSVVRDAIAAGGNVPASLSVYIAPVLARHDMWVKQDKNLSSVARELYLKNSESLRLLFDIPEVK